MGWILDISGWSGIEKVLLYPSMLPPSPKLNLFLKKDQKAKFKTRKQG